MIHIACSIGRAAGLSTNKNSKRADKQPADIHIDHHRRTFVKFVEMAAFEGLNRLNNCLSLI